MKIELYKLYQYVLGDWAKIDVKADLDEKLKSKAIEKRKENITNFLAELGIEKDPTFRAALRTLKSTHLENFIFGNTTDEIKESYVFPDEDAIKIKFQELEAKYHYFTEEKQAKNALKNFIMIFKACKLAADFVEYNNDPENTVPALHAYKILAIFNGFPDFEKYLSSYNFYKLKKPIHDALIYRIPDRNEKDSFTLSAWQKLILKSGKQAMELFNMASAIEKQLNRVPKNITEVVEAAKQIKYKQVDKNPELAGLCLQYHVKEALFDECLEIDTRRKKRDNLPNITVDGAEIEKQGYHLVKLPIDDPRAYILGHITNCCQSIGGHSEECVIDGVTRENNGFYVLLKNKQESEIKSASPLDAKGHINYAQFEIVGQGYAWLGRQGSLVFDSWENRTPNRDNEIIVPMLEKFAHKVINAENSSILRVNIGTGGKTPDIYESKITDYPEKMIEGIQYGDSRTQSVIYCNEELRKEVIENFKKAMLDVLSEYKEEDLSAITQEELINWISEEIYSKSYPQKMIQLFKSDQKFVKQFLVKKDLKIAKGKFHFSSIIALYEKDLLSDEYPWAILIEKASGEGRLISDEVDLIIKICANLKPLNWHAHPIVAEGMRTASCRELEVYERAIEKLIKLNIHDADVEMFQNILKGIFKHYLVVEMVEGYKKLRKLQLDKDPEVRAYLLSSFKDWGTLADSFKKLIDVGLDQNKDIRKKVLSDPGASTGFIDAYLQLKEINLDQDQEIREFVFNHSGHTVKRYVEAFPILQSLKLENDPGLRKQLFNDGDMSFASNMKVYAELLELKLENDCEIRELVLNVNGGHKRDAIVPAFRKLKALHLENDSDIRKHVFKSIRGTFNGVWGVDLLIPALTKLVEMKESANLGLRKWIFDSPGCCDAIFELHAKLKAKNLAFLEADALVRSYVDNTLYRYNCDKIDILSNRVIKSFLKLKEMKLTDNPEIANVISGYRSSTFEKDIENIVALFDKLSAAKIPFSDAIIKAICTMPWYIIGAGDVVKILLAHPENAEQIANACLQLAAFKLDSYSDIIKKITNKNYKFNLNDINSALTILKEMKLENDRVLRNGLLYGPANIKPCMAVYSKLMELKLSNEAKLREAILYVKPAYLDKVYPAFVQLQKMNMENNYKAREVVFENIDKIDRIFHLFPELLAQKDTLFDKVSSGLSSFGLFSGVKSFFQKTTAEPKKESSKPPDSEKNTQVLIELASMNLDNNRKIS